LDVHVPKAGGKGGGKKKKPPAPDKTQQNFSIVKGKVKEKRKESGQKESDPVTFS